ncbi:Zinc finger protein dzip1 [Irineochytrium annulatum]|nr:Zinc finger protein dzip1 [Irineochytrium annulatum]
MTGAKASTAASAECASGFFFKNRSERLDWRMLASIHIERIRREVRSSRFLMESQLSIPQIDIGALQDIMENITFCDVDAEDIRYVDPNFVKLFQLAQLIIEYLLHSQDYLAETRSKLTSETEKARKELSTLKEQHERQSLAFVAMRKQMRVLKRNQSMYETMARTAARNPAPMVMDEYFVGISRNTRSHVI